MTKEVQSRNTYFVCPGKEPIEWDIFNSNKKINLHTDYFQKTFLAMEEGLAGAGWTFYLTWDLKQLPSYGPKVVAVLLGDERARMPRYARKVGMIFKSYGVGPSLGYNPLVNPSYQNWLTFSQYLYARFRWGWSVIEEWQKRKKTTSLKTPIYPIPLGYANQVEVPFIPFSDRPVDVSFAGSVVHREYKWWAIQKWCKTPKSYSRTKMVAALKHYSDAYPSTQVNLKITPNFKAMRREDPNEYSRRVMQTRISLVPRGASFETYRFFESMRFGCVILSEYLPDFWFYKDAPAIRITDWRHLERELNTLMENPEKANKIHEQTIHWWNTVCSEKAVGKYMADRLNESLPASYQSPGSKT